MSRAGRVGLKPGEGAEDGHGHTAPRYVWTSSLVPEDNVPRDSDEVSSFVRLNFGPCDLDMYIHTVCQTTSIFEVMRPPIVLLWLTWVQFSCSVVSDSLQPHELQHTRPPCPSPTPRVYSNSCPSSRWCHPAISSSAVPFSSCPQSLLASGSFPMSQLFTRGGQSTGVSASALGNCTSLL